MTIVSGGPGPYATTASCLLVFEKHMQVGVRTLNLEVLQRIGVSESLSPRTLRALILLGWYDENGQVTPAFDATRRMSADDAREALSAMLRQAYADVLRYIDPATAPAEDIERQFRAFEPTGQVPRMVHLFIGLFTYVGIRQPTDSGPRVNASAGRPAQRKQNTASPRTGKRPAIPTRDVPVHQTTLDVAPEVAPSVPPPSLFVQPKPAQVSISDHPPGERVHVKLGAAGTVTAYVDVRWLELPDETFTKLRQAIRAIEGLAYEDSAPPLADAVKSSVSGERAS